MDWITDCATRLITSQIFEKYKNPDDELHLWTEFMNADGFIINPSKVVRHLMSVRDVWQWPSLRGSEADEAIHNKHFTLTKPIAQIYWGNAKTLIETAKILVEKYADDFSGIELNTWCPSNTVMKCGWWSDMLKHRPETLAIIKSLSEIVKSSKKLTFSVKSRAGLNEEDKPEQLQFLSQISPFCDLITIHGRTLKQLYSWEADFSFIQQVKSQVACPIFANGGITSYQQAEKNSQERDFNALMIGQGAIGNPRVFTPHEPTLEEKIEVIKEHLEMMIACELWFENWGEKIEDYKFNQPKKTDLEFLKKEINPEAEYRSVVEFRKYLFQYIKGISNSREWKQEIISVKTYGDLMEKLEKLRFLM